MMITRLVKDEDRETPNVEVQFGWLIAV